MRIRTVTKQDLGACARILAKEFKKQGEPWTVETAKNRLADFLFLEKHDRALNFVLEQDSKIIGFAFNEIIHYFQGKILWLGELAIDSNFQGKGFGKEALEFIEKAAKKKGLKTIILTTNKKENAFKIYKKLGYKQTNYFFMEKNLK